MATYVLVHGAWHGGWCWQRVAPLLRQTGQARPGLMERVRLMPRGMLVGSVATLLVFVTGLLAFSLFDPIRVDPEGDPERSSSIP